MSMPEERWDVVNPHNIPPQKVGHPLLAWLVILCLVTLIVGLPYLHGGPPTVSEGLHADTQRMLARMLVGMEQLEGKEAEEVLIKQADALNTGSVRQRLRAIILIGELGGPEQALERLKALDAKLAANSEAKTTEEEKQTRRLLGKLFTRYAAGQFVPAPLDVLEQERLHETLGWFADLALSPKNGPDVGRRDELLGSTRELAETLGEMLIGLVVLGLAGLIGLILLVIHTLGSGAQGQLSDDGTRGSIYAETFAVWLVLFLGLHLFVGSGDLIVLCLASLASLFALAWPVFRGIPWSEVRRDIGWTAGERPPIEPFVGVLGYGMAIPLALVGLIGTVILLGLQNGASGHPGDSFDPIQMPTHPVLERLIHGNTWDRLQLFLLGSLVAPIVEETMFRGVLYRHLRNASRPLGFLASFLISALAVSFLFAVIHPQGPVAVPVLMALALALTILREWRGTLIPSMVAHGINNGMVFILIIVLLS